MNDTLRNSQRALPSSFSEPPIPFARLFMKDEFENLNKSQSYTVNMHAFGLLVTKTRCEEAQGHIFHAGGCTMGV